MLKHLEDLYLGPLPLVAPSSERRFVWEPTQRQVRVVFGGETLAQSAHVMLLLEAGRLPVYYFPRADVRAGPLERTDHIAPSELKGPATFWTVRIGEHVAENAAWSHESPRDSGPNMAGYVAFYWDMMDAWYEEDERAYAHARDPYKLIDVRQSSRRVRVELAGVTVAETRRPRLLFETGLPVRYYIPREDVRMELFEPSATTTQCAYKGRASYWSARIGERLHEDVTWSYHEPLALAAQVKDDMSFFQERADTLVEVDGEQVERPHTPWSS